MAVFSSTVALSLLKKHGIHYLVDKVYAYDTQLYNELKHDEGQSAYLKYLDAIQKSIDKIFYQSLCSTLKPLNERFLAPGIENGKKNDITCIVLNNTSLLAHVTVLRSLGNELNGFSHNNRLIIIVLIREEKEKEDIWAKALTDIGFKVVYLKSKKVINRLLEVNSIIKPKQYIWWGWPPGQWLGPLVIPNALHRSVSFKYDFPIAKFFASHHIGYGSVYAQNIKCDTPVFGFQQKFLPELIPTLSEEKLNQSIEQRKLESRKYPIKTKKIINLGTLGRAEKVAQVEFLSSVKSILQFDKRTIFHFTGRTYRKDIQEYFQQYKLADRVVFHGWVKPYDYLQKIDIYLDTYPFGTGETLVCAGYMGLPTICMYSPYEANFSNMLFDHKKASEIFLSFNSRQYCQKVIEILHGGVLLDSSKISHMYREVFYPYQGSSLTTNSTQNNSGLISGLEL